MRVQRTRVLLPAVARRSPLKRRPLGSPNRLLAVSLSVALTATSLLGEGLLVYGKDWSFLVTEPTGWHGDARQLAAKYETNIVFVPDTHASRKEDVTIRVRVNKKTDEDISQDLEADMAGYRRKFSAISFSELSVEHPSYPLVAKLFAVRGHFAEYVTYLNPGKEYPYILSVALSTVKDQATPEEFAAYREVVRSLQFTRKTA